jgi:zinc and cadmium transporter
MQTLYWIILMTGINGLLAFAGIFSFLITKKFLNKITIYLVAFATGALLGGALFHFIPESLEELKITKTILITLAGFLSFFLIEKYLHWHHCHKQEGECKHPVGFLILFGDGIHNFIDGLIIAGSFLVSVPLGILSSLLIMAHELPQEIGDFGVLLHSGYSRGKALFYNFLSQITAVLGGILGFYTLTIESAIFLLPFAAGGFLYIAIIDLVPEIFKEKNKARLIGNLLSIILGILLLISGKWFVG